MGRDETPPFARGQTYYGGGTIDSSNLGGTNLCGKEWTFEDVTYGTNSYVRVRAVRNTGTIVLAAGRLVQFDPLYYYTGVNGYVTVNYGPGVVLDEFLPTAGLLANDVGYVVVEGPTLVWTALDAGADNVIVFNDPLAALTAVTSGSTTSGRVATAQTSGQTTSQRDSLLNVVGRALSAKTTANTNTQALMFAERWF